jgi:O-antigen/teichoic acid export membrane protein
VRKPAHLSGNQNICALVYALTLALNIALSITLIPQFGLMGAAWATAISMTFEAAALSFTAWRRLGIAMVIFAAAGSTRRRG